MARRRRQATSDELAFDYASDVERGKPMGLLVNAFGHHVHLADATTLGAMYRAGVLRGTALEDAMAEAGDTDDSAANLPTGGNAT